MNRRKKSNKATGRSYKYDTAYQARPEQKKRRAQRNKARRAAIKAGKIKKGSKMDVDHIDAPKRGSLAKVKTRIIPRSKNRGIKK